MGVDKACVHPPPYCETTWRRRSPAGQNVSPSVRVPDWGTGGATHLATIIFPGSPLFFKFSGAVAAFDVTPISSLHTPTVPVCVRRGGYASPNPAEKFARGSPLFSKFLIFSGPVADSAGTLVASLTPPSLCL